MFIEFGAKFESTVTENIDELLQNVTRNENNTSRVQESEEGRFHIELHNGVFCLMMMTMMCSRSLDQESCPNYEVVWTRTDLLL